MKTQVPNFEGLTPQKVLESRAKWGINKLSGKGNKSLLQTIYGIFLEPMFLLLTVAAVIYLIVGEYSEGIIMFISMLFVAFISLYQERKSQKALDAVKKMSQPKAKAVRNGIVCDVDAEEIVPGDIVLADEGEQVIADGVILESYDFTVDESILTGESLPAEKKADTANNQVLAGSTVKTGSAFIKITATGNNTMIGKLGISVDEMVVHPSRFQKEIKSFVRKMAITGVVAFILVLIINYSKTNDFLVSLLFALTLAMAIIPEEIPVAFSTFMALGSWRLLQEKVLVKDPQTVEMLGSATVICIDKTGTITENKMQVAAIFNFEDKKIHDPSSRESLKIIENAMWSSEPDPFDPMEIAIHEAYEKFILKDERNNFKIIHEYPLCEAPPVMTHIHENNKGERRIACKGGIETLLEIAAISETDKKLVFDAVNNLCSKGYRVLGVGSTRFEGNNFPESQRDFNWNLEGLIGLYDPPKSNTAAVLEKFYESGINVKIISGDFPETTMAIAKEVNFRGAEKVITGKEIILMKDEDLKSTVAEYNIFARMFPDAKLRIINALKANGEIVAMTGDGVNDGPALKAADIGISMGSGGTEIARRAASIVLLNNNLDRIFYALLSGRKIFTNLKKAIRYIVSIHIPIITLVLIPLLFDWDIVNIFSPVHVIFFELIMGPTCSIIYENEPMDGNLMEIYATKKHPAFLTFQELWVSIVQGSVIASGGLLLYYFAMNNHFPKELITSLVFTYLTFANIFLTLSNRSFTQPVYKTIFNKNKLIPFIIGITIFMLTIILNVETVRKFFLVKPLDFYMILTCIFLAFISVFWIEIFKVKRKPSGK